MSWRGSLTRRYRPNVGEDGRRAGPEAVGFDLDLTLADTREATAVALECVNDSLGVTIDVAQCIAEIGPPVRQLIAPWVPPERLDEVVADFRAAFVREAVGLVRVLPGAHEAFDLAHRQKRSVVVITSRMPPVASAILQQCGLAPDIVVGGQTGVEKASAMREFALAMYLGDHPLDMHGATAAGVVGVGVTSGSHSASELRTAGATHVIQSLHSLTELLPGGGT